MQTMDDNGIVLGYCFGCGVVCGNDCGDGTGGIANESAARQMYSVSISQYKDVEWDIKVGMFVLTCTVSHFFRRRRQLTVLIHQGPSTVR